MNRRIGYIITDQRPQHDAAFWKAREHYQYVETTIPHPKSKIDALKSAYKKPTDEALAERAVFGYHDFNYCGDNEQPNISDWKRDLLPAKDDARFVRDESGVVIPRFGGRGLWVPQPNSNAARKQASGVVAKCQQLGCHLRIDDHSPDLGWNFGGKTKIRWNGKLFTKQAGDFIASDGTLFSVVYNRAANDWINLVRGYGGTDFLVVASSGTKWLAGSAAKLSGRLQEENITPASFMSEPWNKGAAAWPLAMTYPDTWQRVVDLMNTNQLPGNVVVIEGQDCGGRVIAQPAKV